MCLRSVREYSRNLWNLTQAVSQSCGELEFPSPSFIWVAQSRHCILYISRGGGGVNVIHVKFCYFFLL